MTNENFELKQVLGDKANNQNFDMVRFNQALENAEKWAGRAVVALPLLAMAGSASAGLTEGLTTAKSKTQEITTAAYALIGIAAGAYLLWQAVLCWNGKKDWSDMVPAIIHVAIAGGALTLATFAWQSMSS